MQQTLDRNRRIPLTLLAVVAFLALFGAGYATLASYLSARAAEQTPQQAAFFAAAIDDSLSRLRHLSYVIATERITLDALQGGDTRSLNLRLEEVAARSGAEFVYVLDINGETIASSNFRQQDSLVGNFYTFRPYFLDALKGGQGQFYAVGVTTGRPGYFVSHPVSREDGTVFGVVTTKIGFAELSRSLANSGALVMVSDRQGVVITSSDPSLIYGHLDGLSAFERREIQQNQQFRDEDLFPLDWVPQPPGRVMLDGTTYLWTVSDLQNEDWTLHLLSDLGDLRRTAMLYVAIGALGALTLLVAAMVYRSMQLRQALSVSDADRTRLAAEIEERRRAEERLRTAQVALAHKTQLETLGRFSVSITHELGQPISAMRNYLAAEEIATGAAPGSGWPELTGLVARMQRLIDQLRHFGRQKSRADSKPFNAQQAVSAAVELTRHSAEAKSVTIRTDLPPAPITLDGDPGRFEQVIVNLIRNAIDASAQAGGGYVDVALTATDALITLSVQDDGQGIGTMKIDDLREPFFTTKRSGEGMGLGLAISAQIVDEMGGSLTAANSDGVGARFTVTFAAVARTDA